MRRSALRIRRSSLPSVADRPPPTSLPHSLYRSTGRRLFQNSVVTSICIPTRVYVYRPSHMYISTRVYVYRPAYMYIDQVICISTRVYVYRPAYTGIKTNHSHGEDSVSLVTCRLLQNSFFFAIFIYRLCYLYISTTLLYLVYSPQ